MARQVFSYDVCMIPTLWTSSTWSVVDGMNKADLERLRAAGATVVNIFARCASWIELYFQTAFYPCLSVDFYFVHTGIIFLSRMEKRQNARRSTLSRREIKVKARPWKKISKTLLTTTSVSDGRGVFATVEAFMSEFGKIFSRTIQCLSTESE